MGKKAYSYLRFSTLGQALGDSHRRQIAMAQEYAAARGLILDDILSFQDLGISAYRSRNAKVGALRTFLDAIESEVIKAGSFLLVESLDRISRDQILAAQGLFLQIISAGITLVTLVDRREYSARSINQNPLELIISLVTMMRANDESVTKSRRCQKVWVKKRTAAAQKPMTSVCPGWLTLDRNTNKFEIKPQEAEVVRRIFRETLNVKGRHTIARELNEDDSVILSARRGHNGRAAPFWHAVTVSKILRSSTVIGTMTPTTEIREGESYKRVEHLPILNYYPAVIDPDDFRAVQEMATARRAAYAKHPHRTGIRNILSNLSRCADCGGAMAFASSGGRPHRYLHCYRAQSGAGCLPKYIRYSHVEDAILSRLQELFQARERFIDPPRETKHHAAEYIKEAPSIDKNNVKYLNPLFQERLQQIERMTAKKALDIQKINAALRGCLVAVTIDYRSHSIILRWRDGAVGRFHNVWPSSYLPDVRWLQRVSGTGKPYMSAGARQREFGKVRGRNDGRYPALTLKLVAEVQQRLSDGESQMRLAQQFGVSRATISRIHRGIYAGLPTSADAFGQR